MSQNWRNKSRPQRGRGRGKPPHIYYGNDGTNYNSMEAHFNGSYRGRSHKQNRPVNNPGDKNGTWKNINGQSYCSRGKSLTGNSTTSEHQQNSHRGMSSFHKMNNGRGRGRGHSHGQKRKIQHSFKPQKDLRNLINRKPKSLFQQRAETLFPSTDSMSLSFEEAQNSHPKRLFSIFDEENQQPKMLFQNQSHGPAAASSSSVWEPASSDKMERTVKLRHLTGITEVSSSLIDSKVVSGNGKPKEDAIRDKIIFNLANPFNANAPHVPAPNHRGFGHGYGRLPSGRFY